MRYFKLLLLLLVYTSKIKATDKIEIATVTIPVWHTLSEQEVKYATLPYVGWDNNNIYLLSGLYTKPYVAGKQQDILKQDINLLSVYKLAVVPSYDPQTKIMTVYIVTGNASKPKTHHYSVDDVVKMAVVAVRKDYPDELKYEVKVSTLTAEVLLKKMMKN